MRLQKHVNVNGFSPGVHPTSLIASGFRIWGLGFGVSGLGFRV